MGTFLGAIVLPLLLLSASLMRWNLLSFVDLLAFFAVQFTTHTRGYEFWRRSLVLQFVILFSLLAVSTHIIFNIVWFLEGKWTKELSWWAMLIGFERLQQWRSKSTVYFLIIQSLVAFVAFAEIHADRIQHRYLSRWSFSSSVNRLGPHLKVACCLLLPAIQLVVGISHPSWICLPFFICSCVGLVDWSMTSNFLGLFRWWRPLLIYTCFVILLFYLYQLPVEIPKIAMTTADFIGLYKISITNEGPEITSGISSLIFYFMLSSVKCDLEDMDYIMSLQGSGLTEQLIPSSHSFFIRESRLIAICEDIYAARAENELEVEEVLYWTLVKIYRSPHMLLEYTKPD